MPFIEGLHGGYEINVGMGGKVLFFVDYNSMYWLRTFPYLCNKVIRFLLSNSSKVAPIIILISNFKLTTMKNNSFYLVFDVRGLVAAVHRRT